jgi:hypothetical protein
MELSPLLPIKEPQMWIKVLVMERSVMTLQVMVSTTLLLQLLLPKPMDMVERVLLTPRPMLPVRKMKQIPPLLLPPPLQPSPLLTVYSWCTPAPLHAAPMKPQRPLPLIGWLPLSWRLMSNERSPLLPLLTVCSECTFALQ